jgi:hypothetical protein
MYLVINVGKCWLNRFPVPDHGESIQGVIDMQDKEILTWRTFRRKRRFHKLLSVCGVKKGFNPCTGL